MITLTHLADTIEQHFVSPNASSFAHFVVVSDGLTGAQAATAPGERLNSIWAITNHMAFWMDYTCTALLQEEADLRVWGLEEVGNGWPPLGPISDEGWQAARQRAMDICQAFATAIRTVDPAILDLPQARLYGGTPYQAITSMYGHNCYHTAELLTVRHLQGLWVEHRWT